MAGLIAIAALFVGMSISHLISSDNIYNQLNKLKDILVISDKYYVDEVDTDKLVEGAIQGIVKELDPHSVYFPAKSFEKVTEEMTGKFQGVGLQIRSLNDTIIVVEPIGGGPAARLGIQSNDRIVGVGDSSIVGFSSEDAAKRLRGPKGTKVKVSIIRVGVGEPLLYEITRDDIALFTVDVSFMVGSDVGYVAVNRFNTQTNDEMMKALNALKAQGMKRLVLDLRGNPGGILQQAVMMADLFLDGGPTETPHKVVYTKARRPELSEDFFASSGQPFERTPLIVLINPSSASASEIVAGAIQDWDRGLVVGETSFGKGLVQREWPISDGSAFRLTIARYYTPSGRLIQRAYEGKNKTDYMREAFEREEEEGTNINHDLDAHADSLRPKFHTNGGRVVYGGGGITPDYIVKTLDLTEQSKILLRRDLMYQFIAGFLDEQGKSIRDQYGADLQLFKKDYMITDEVLISFRGFLAKNDVKVNQEEFDKDLNFLVTRMKAYVARSMWGNEGWYSVMLDVDPQFRKAVDLFPEAIRLMATK